MIFRLVQISGHDDRQEVRHRPLEQLDTKWVGQCLHRLVHLLDHRWRLTLSSRCCCSFSLCFFLSLSLCFFLLSLSVSFFSLCFFHPISQRSKSGGRSRFPSIQPCKNLIEFVLFDKRDKQEVVNKCEMGLEPSSPIEFKPSLAIARGWSTSPFNFSSWFLKFRRFQYISTTSLLCTTSFPAAARKNEMDMSTDVPRVASDLEIHRQRSLHGPWMTLRYKGMRRSLRLHYQR